jgi:hypothetical protein
VWAPFIIIIIIHAASDLRCSILIEKKDFEIAIVKLGKTQLLFPAVEAAKQTIGDRQGADLEEIEKNKE